MFTQIIAQLKTVQLLKTVGGSVDFGGIETAPKALNAAYVLPAADKSGPNTLANGIEQHSILRFSVAICAANFKTASGESSMGDMPTVRAAIDAALLGWEPLPEYDVIVHDSGNLIKIGNGVLWWKDDYITGYYRRK